MAMRKNEYCALCKYFMFNPLGDTNCEKDEKLIIGAYSNACEKIEKGR